MQSTDDLFKRFFSSVDSRPALPADGFRINSSASAAGCTSSSLVIARQRRLNAKEKLLQDFDKTVDDVSACLWKTKCPAAMDVVPADVSTETLVFRSKINHTKNALAKVQEEEAHETPRSLAIMNIYRRVQAGNYCMCATRPKPAVAEHQVWEQDSPRWGLKPWAFTTAIDNTTTSNNITTAGVDTTTTAGDRITTVDNDTTNVNITATDVDTATALRDT